MEGSVGKSKIRSMCTKYAHHARTQEVGKLRMCTYAHTDLQAKQPLGFPALALGCLGAIVSNSLLRVTDPSLLILAVHTVALAG